MSNVDDRSAIAETVPCSLKELTLYFVKLGSFGFGGPIALAGYMQRDLVERRRWITDRDYKEGLALAQLAPGPLAAQLAMYLGWVRARVLGATLVGVAFVLPSFLMVLGIAALYVTYGGLPWMHGAFYGIGAAVIAIIARSVLKLARLTLARDPFLWALAVVSALVTAWTESEIFWLFVGSGVIAVLVKVRQRRPVIAASLVAPWSVSLMLLTAVSAPAGILFTILRYFTVAGLVVFGSGLAVVPFLHGGVVQQYHWLTERQFLDAIAVSMITPGPVVITVAFIGYLVAGLPGAVLAAIGIFVPCYLTVVVAAPHFHRLSGNRSVRAFVDGVTAAATGAIAGAAFVLGRRAIVDLPTVLIAFATLTLLFLPKRIPEPALILAAGITGILLNGVAPVGAY